MTTRFRFIATVGSRLSRNYSLPNRLFSSVQIHSHPVNQFRIPISGPLLKDCKFARAFATGPGKPTSSSESKKQPKADQKPTPEESSSSDSDSDSSSDEEGLRGETPFWRQKMRTHHHAIDINKDGTVSWDDFEMLAQRFETLGNLDKAQSESFRSVLRDFWEEYWGASTDPYAFVMQEDFLKSMHHVVNTPELRKKVAKPLPYFFRAVDHDGSGEISVEEYKLFYKCLGMSEADAVNSFKAIDADKDGKLSLEEFVRLGRDFFVSEDESRPSKFFWGPLTP